MSFKLNHYRNRVLLFPCLVIFIALTLFTAATSSDKYYEFQKTLARANYLITSDNRDNYIWFTANGNKINFEGKYTDAVLSDIKISSSTIKHEETNLSLSDDGTFKGYISCEISEMYSYITVSFEDKAGIRYRVEYDNGWFFGENGLLEKNRAKLSSPNVLLPSNTAYYISASGDKTEITETLDELVNIANNVTIGLENDYEKAKALAFWVEKNIYYDLDTKEDSVTAETVAAANILDTRRTICIGYVNIYAALLESINIPALCIQGSSTGAKLSYENLLTDYAQHGWVAFWYADENRWVHTDPTWDSNNYYENNEYRDGVHSIGYFDASESVIAKVHRIDRAERRDFLAVREYIENIDSIPSVTTTVDTSKNIEETLYDFSDDLEESDNISGITAPENNTILYIVIAALVLSIVLIVIYILYSRKH